MTLDLTQFHDAFFEESFEALDSMEAALLKLDIGDPDPELVNTIFRVAHSIKGGSATFGFSEIASFTHSLETLLDELRGSRMQVTVAISDLLLKSVDVMREMLRSVHTKQPLNAQRVADLQFDLELVIAQKPSIAPAPAPMLTHPTPHAQPSAPTSGNAAAGTHTAQAVAPASADNANGGSSAAAATSNTSSANSASNASGGSNAASGASSAVPARWHILFRPFAEFFTRGNDPLRMLRELSELGSLEVTADTSALPAFKDLDAQTCYLSWTIDLDGSVSEAAIREVFDWAEGDCDLEIRRAGGEAAATATEVVSEAAADAILTESAAAESAHAGAQGTASANAASEPDSASPSTAAAPGNAGNAGNSAASAPVPTGPSAGSPELPVPPPTVAAAPATKADSPNVAAVGDSGSIRVSVEKIDELMNTVGELVITQAMLSQLGRNLEGPAAEELRAGLAQLERNMRELQESVMRVRMLPISFVFSRFPRMVRDLAQRLGKQIELKLTGEQTELDKTVMEKIGDPLVHLVRNSVDHGIEKTPEARIAAGKSPVGTVHLDACHRGGNIAVEVSDDGGGLDKDRILEKARSRGLIGPNDVLTDEQVYELIFMPGFSTAEKTTDVSGRGVGMDVVRRNVKELGGKIEIRSERGKGSRFIITLPLTLAIVDGQSVAVGTETYIVPLISIVESLQLKTASVSRLSGKGEVFSFRGDYLPIVRLHELFGVEPRARALNEGLVVVAEGDGRRVGLFVDDLLGQQQVVIKSLEANYGHVEGVSGATILGDGSVALILDLAGLIRAASMRSAA
jgi:two-component system, chemotaxis family, sensor kinase CheA